MMFCLYFVLLSNKLCGIQSISVFSVISVHLCFEVTVFMVFFTMLQRLTKNKNVTQYQFKIITQISKNKFL